MASSQGSLRILQLLSASRDLANRAGILIRTVFETGNLHIIDKSMKVQKELHGIQGLKATDPQTIADIAVQQLIQSSLNKTFPGISVIGEEDINDLTKTKLINPIEPHLELPDIYQKTEAFHAFLYGKDYENYNQQELDKKDINIWIDPIDGTKEYTQGIKDAVTCLLGISYKGVPIAGVVNRPFSNQTIFGIVGVPCLFCEKRKYVQPKEEKAKEEKLEEEYDKNLEFDSIVNVEQITEITTITMKDLLSTRDAKRRVICCSRSHLEESTTKYIEQCKPTSVIRQGGAGGKVLMILEGNADCYVHIAKGTKKWDTCAPQALLECVGGRLTEPNGAPLDYSINAKFPNSNGIIASWNKETHASYCLANANNSPL